MSVKQFMIAAFAALGLSLLGYAAFGAPASQGATATQQTASVRSKSVLSMVKYRRYGRRRGTNRRFYGGSPAFLHGERGGSWQSRRNSGPPYSRCFMNCIYSSH